VWSPTHYNSNNNADRAVIAKAVGASPEELESAFDGVQFYSLADNQAQLTGSFTSETFPHILKSASAAGLVPVPVDAAKMIDARFVKALK
jgi:NitT/TauT family transport system substrate-binding protein